MGKRVKPLDASFRRDLDARYAPDILEGGGGG